MNKNIIFVGLCFLTSFFTTFSYEVSGSKWDLLNKDLIVLGDVHLEGEPQHFKKIEEIIDQTKTPTLFLLEDRDWDQVPEFVNNTMPDMCHFAHVHAGKKRLVHFVSADKRTPILFRATLLCDDINNVLERFNFKWSEQVRTLVLEEINRATLSYGKVPTIAEHHSEIAAIIDQLKNVQNSINSEVFNELVQNIQELFSEINKTLKDQDKNRALDSALLSLAKNSKNLKAFIHRSFIELDLLITDAFFIAQLNEHKNDYERIVFLIGQAHTESINKFLNELRQKGQATQIMKVGSDNYSFNQRPKALAVHTLESLFKDKAVVSQPWFSSIATWFKNCFSFVTYLWK